MYSIENHKIYLDFSPTFPELVSKVYKAHKQGSRPDLSKNEAFIFNLFYKMNEIENKLRDLDLSIAFLLEFSTSKPKKMKKMKKMKTTGSKYLTYHLEYYHINIVALFDRILHLVNYIYDLGLADKFVSLQGIITNSHIDLVVSKQLRKLDKDLQPIRTTQNNIKHKEGLHVNELEHPSLLEFHLTHEILTDKFSAEEQVFMQKDINFLYREFIQTKKTELSKLNESIGKDIEILLDGLWKPYTKRKAELSA